MATKNTTSTDCNISAQLTDHQHQKPKASSSSSSSSAMDPTAPKSKLHPTAPADAVVAPSSTIQTISSRFAKLYANHKMHASLNGSGGMAHSILHFQEKALNNSCVLDKSCLGLTKSNSQHGRNGVEDWGKKSSCTRTKVKVKDKKSVVSKSHMEVDVEKALARQKFDEAKGLSLAQKEKEKKKEFCDGKDVKLASALMLTSRESHKSIEIKRPPLSVALNGGRRKSFSCSQAELADFFSCTGVKVVAADMPPFMQIHAVDCARKTHDSLEKFTSKTLAFALKKEFDGIYGPAWHCIVGASFGSFVTHSVCGFLYFSMDHKLYILLFKTSVQRAD